MLSGGCGAIASEEYQVSFGGDADVLKLHYADGELNGMQIISQ